MHFSIRNFGFTTTGHFTGLKGLIVFYPKDLNKSRFTVSIDAASVNTGNGTRDRHLRTSAYLDVTHFALITFVSTAITESKLAGGFVVAGRLTIKGVTRPVEFDFSVNPSPVGYFFEGKFEINRQDFGVGGNSISLSDPVTISLRIRAAGQ